VKVSHTQKELYKVSPFAWYVKYILKYKEEVMSSALFLGSIIEKSVDIMLEGKSLKEAQDLFEKNYQRYKINDTWETLKSSDKVKFFKSDFQENAHTEEELEFLADKPHNFRCWSSRIKSGKLMIQEFHDNILPHIKEVISMQEYVSIDNGSGDQIIGYSDYIVEWEDGRRLVLDLKTSATPYKKDAVLTMEKGSQTALYYSALKDKYKLDGAGFLVLEKKIRKRTPQTRSQIIIGVPPEELIKETFDEFDEMLYNVRQAYFPCKAPDCNRFGQECCNAKFCSSGGVDTTGLWRKNG
jgi:hypothetical protein